MRGNRPALIVCILSLPFATASSRSPTTASPTFSPIRSSIPSTPVSSPDPYSTSVTEINVFSLLKDPSSTGGLLTPAAIAEADEINTSAPVSSSILMFSASPSASSPEGMSNRRRNLIIILCSVLGSSGVLLIALIAFLIRRYHGGQSPFSHRGASPIDDDEIASWRGTMIDHKKSLDNGSAIREVHHSLQLTYSPGWTWTASPTSTRSVLISPTAAFVPGTPSVIAIAPNARAGLTDEAIPGDDPFIAPLKRQSSRLSKAPPAHIRSKSRRSSISARSFHSYRSCTTPRLQDLEFPWRDPDEATTGYFESPGTSIFDGLAGGGLAPRPRSRSNQWLDQSNIGRAIS